MAIGYVYVLSNPAMSELVKVGKTTLDPRARSAQLSAATGVPERFELAKAYQVRDCDEAEAFAHRLLERVFGRPNSGREFFSAAADQVIELLDAALANGHLMAGTNSASADTFTGPLMRLEYKEFTFACAEFEELFRAASVTEEALWADEHLRNAMGAYIAACYAIKRKPYSTVMFGVRCKHAVVTKAIEFAKEFESDPTSGIISFAQVHG
jgi:5-carboxymethyl-2-hydroxymuconate isomerase